MGSKVVTPEGFKLFYHPAKEKKYDVTVVFVHHMWGSNRSTWRHYQLLNEKGFDCVSFDLLMGSSLTPSRYHPYLKYLYKGVFYIWTRQIRSILNHLDGDKILYGFSGPSLAAFWAADGRKDVKKIICDGGPFHRLYSNTKNFFHYVVGLKSPFMYSTAAYFGTALWGYRPNDRLYSIFKRWPQNIPILSVRGHKDNIVALESIEEVFKEHPDLDLTVLGLPHGGHLDGLRDFPEAYKKTMLPFIKKDLDTIN